MHNIYIIKDNTLNFTKKMLYLFYSNDRRIFMILNNKKYALTKKGWIMVSVITVILTSILIYSIFNKEKIILGPYIVKQTTNEKLSNAFRNKERLC